MARLITVNVILGHNNGIPGTVMIDEYSNDQGASKDYNTYRRETSNKAILELPKTWEDLTKEQQKLFKVMMTKQITLYILEAVQALPTRLVQESPTLIQLALHEMAIELGVDQTNNI